MNLSKDLQILCAIPAMWNAVTSGVQLVESALPGVQGSAKLQAGIAATNAFLSNVGADISKVEDIGAALTPLINAAVAIFNVTGLFHHTTTPTTQPGAAT